MEKQENKKEPKKASGKKPTGKKKQAAKKPAGKRKSERPEENVVRIGIIGGGRGLGSILNRIAETFMEREKELKPLEETFKPMKDAIDKMDDILLVFDGKETLERLYVDEQKTKTIYDASEKAYGGNNALDTRSVILMVAKTIASQEFARRKVDKSIPFPPVVIVTTKDGEDLIAAIREGKTEGKLGEMAKEAIACASIPAINKEILDRMAPLCEQLDMLVDLNAIWQTRQLLADNEACYQKEAKEAVFDDTKTFDDIGSSLLKWRLMEFLLEKQQTEMVQNMPYVGYALPGSERDIILIPATFDPPRIALLEKTLKTLIITAIGSIPDIDK